MTSAADAVVLDSHVHVHGCFDTGAFLDAARSNFDRSARAMGIEPPAQAALMLTESAWDDAFGRLLDAAQRGAGAGRWRFATTAEPTSLRARRDDGAELLIVAGSQVVTRERLEVLALGIRPAPADGAGLDETISAVLDGGAVAVLPWGFGKWWGARGRLVDAALRRHACPGLFLGDNGGRPALAATPRKLLLARRSGTWTLPGSDPLPFRREQGKAGRVGCMVRTPALGDSPAARIVAALRALTSQPALYGRYERPFAFVLNQFAMQLRKQRRGS